jgi:hypothetical protein
MLYTDVTTVLAQTFTLLGDSESVRRFFDAPIVVEGISWAQQIALVVCSLCIAALAYMRFLKATVRAPQAKAPLAVSTPMSATPRLAGRWSSVQGKLDSPREQDWKLAILEADTIADEALKATGVGGSSFGDRLSQVPVGQLSSLDGLWWAHKVRNRVAHELDYFLRYTEARQAVQYYEAALRELGML